jgi:hypothetical protein
LTWSTLQHREKVQLVKAAWQPDFSASKLANALAELLDVPVISRLSIIGIYNRNQDFRKTHPLGGRGGTREKAGITARVRTSRPKPIAAPLPNTIEAELKVTEDALAYDKASLHVRLLGLASGECKWPVKSPPPSQKGQYLFCGLPARRGHHYCTHHFVRSRSKLAREVAA